MKKALSTGMLKATWLRSGLMFRGMDTAFEELLDVPVSVDRFAFERNQMSQSDSRSFGSLPQRLAGKSAPSDDNNREETSVSYVRLEPSESRSLQHPRLSSHSPSEDQPKASSVAARTKGFRADPRNHVTRGSQFVSKHLSQAVWIRSNSVSTVGGILASLIR